MRRSDLVFFLSGAAALAYETVWARLMSRVLGSDAPAAAIVIAVFMGGMGLGAHFAAEIARTTKRPVRLFAIVEIVVAAWAALSPFLLARIHPVDSFAARALVGTAVLLPPTLLLGATFPLMARIAIRTDAETGSETSAFYGANTLGAAIGALLGSFVLMPTFGLTGALVAAAGLDVAAAALAIALFSEPEARVDELRAARVLRAWSEPLLWATFLFGAASLALEVLLLRLLVSVTGASVFAFAIVTAVFLFGIGIGSRQLAERRTRTGVADSALDERGLRSRAVVFWCGVSVPLLAVAGLLALRLQLGEADLFAGLSNRAPQGASVLKVWLSHALFAALCLLPPAIAFGMALPSASSALVAARKEWPRERALGLLYAWNTTGALIGSLAAGFVLMPMLGMRVAVALVLLIPPIAALAVDRTRMKSWAMGTLAACVVGILVFGPARPREARDVVVFAHDAHTSALVEDTHTKTGALVRSLRVNGKPEASTAKVDVRLQRLLGHIPGILHGDVKRALVIGLGTGMTAGSLLDLPTLEALEIVEISKAVTHAARAFSDWNGAVLDDKRTQLVIGDGRHRLATTDARFDLITSDPVHPWTRGSSDLYTLEHFRAMRAHLAEGGVASQWLPLYELSTEDVKTIVSTWCAAFEHVSAWLTAYDLVLVGSGGELPHERDLAARDLYPRVRAAGEHIGVSSGVDLAALQCAGDAELRALVSGVEPMRDDRPVIEFRAPLSSFSGYSTEILRWATRADFVDRLPESARARGRDFRALVARFLDELPRGFTPAADRLGEELARLPLSTPSEAR